MGPKSDFIKRPVTSYQWRASVGYSWCNMHFALCGAALAAILEYWLHVILPDKAIKTKRTFILRSPQPRNNLSAKNNRGL